MFADSKKIVNFVIQKTKKTHNIMKKAHTRFPKGSFTLVTTNVEYSYADYDENCELNDIEPAEEGSYEFYEWCEEMIAEGVDCDLENIDRISDRINEVYVIEGSLGLWNGRPSIIPVIMSNLADAIKKCIGECQYFDVTWENGVISISASHHDGTNHFEIHALSKKGLNRYYNAYNKDKDFEPLEGDYKRIPHPYYVY